MPSTICTLATCLCLTYMPTAGWAFGEPDVQLNNYTEGGDAVIQGLLGDNEPDPGAPFGNHNPADDIPRLTNFFNTSPAAQEGVGSFVYEVQSSITKESAQQ